MEKKTKLQRFLWERTYTPCGYVMMYLLFTPYVLDVLFGIPDNLYNLFVFPIIFIAIYRELNCSDKYFNPDN